MAIYPKVPHGSIKENPIGWLQYLNAIREAIRAVFDSSQGIVAAVKETALDVCRTVDGLLLFAAAETLHRSFVKSVTVYRLQPEDPRNGDIWLEGMAEQYTGRGWDEISDEDLRVALSIVSEGRDRTRIFFPEGPCVFPASEGDIYLKNKSLSIFSKEKNAWNTTDCSERLYETGLWIANIQTESGEGKGAFTESSLKFYKYGKFIGGISGGMFFKPDGKGASIWAGVQ